MAEGYARIANLLLVTFTSADDCMRKQAEKELEALGQDRKGMIESLIWISANGSTLHLCLAAATRLRHYVRDIVEASALDLMEKAIVAEEIFKVMLMDRDKNLRIALSLIINYLTSEDKGGSLLNKLSQLAIQNLFGPISSVQASLLLIKNLFNITSSEFSTKTYFATLLPYLLQVSTSAYTSLHEAFISKNEDLVSKSLSVLSSWADSFSQILEHFEMISPKTLKEIIKNVDLASLFVNILTFKIHNKFIIFESNQISNDFASMKTFVLKCLNILIQFIMDSKKKLLEEQEKVKNLQTLVGMDLPDTPFVNVCSSVIHNLIDTLLEISSEMVIPQISDNEGKLFIIESIELCVKCCGESRFFPVFAEVYKKLVLEFVPNALNMLKLERDNAEEDPSEFVNMGMDICERQESENIRSTVAKLLETICDNIDGALTFFVGAIIQTIDICLSSRLNSSDPNQVFLYSYDEERVLNNAILMLCTVSYNISRRKDLVQNLEHVLSKYFDVLANARSGVIHSRLCLMLYFYSEHLYQEDECWLMKWFWFLIGCMSPANTSKISMTQACETFSSLVQEEELMLRIHAFIPEVFSKLILCVPAQNNKNFFEAISEFLNWHTELSKDQALELVHQLVQKIQFLVSNYQSSKENTILIAKCWNIIKGVSNSEVLANSFGVKDIQVEFERILSPLVLMLNQPQKQSFEDDIITVMVNMMKKNKSVSKIQWDMFGILPLLQQKQEDSLHGFLKIINNYILFGNEYIINTANCLSCLVEMAVKALYSRKAQEIKEPYNAEGAILLQYIITAFPGFLDTYLPTLLSSVISRYREPPIKENFLKVRLLSVVLSALAYNFSLTCSILANEFYSQNVTFLRYIFLEILANHSGFEQIYDKKAAVLGLCQMFSQPSLPQDLTELSNHIFETLILIMTSKPTTEDPKKTKMNKLLEKIITNEIDDMADSEIMVKGARLLYSDTNAGTNTDENEVMISAASVLTNLIEFDEIGFFKQVLNGLNTSNPGWIKSVIGSLTEERQKQLVEIVMSKTIKLDFPGTPTVVRKIVKAKRK